MEHILDKLNAMVWGVPTLILILGVGLYFSCRTGFAQIRMLPKGLRRFFAQLIPGKDAAAGRSSYRALCTALGATVGTGNLVGVAGAIALGGPGSIFWMWVCGLIGMMTKFAEVVLAVMLRERTASGEYIGGPMYIIRNGLGKKWHILAGIYAFLGVFAALGVGNATQVNSVVVGICDAVLYMGGSVSPAFSWVLCTLIALLIGILLSGGASKIGSASEALVPFAAVGYFSLCVIALIIQRDRLSEAFLSIVLGAFQPKAVTGGVISSVFIALRVGAARGVFTNEAGMGTASIAHASAEVAHPVTQGVMGIVEVFLDTIVICTMTALVILTSGVSLPFGRDTGVSITMDAFSAVLGSWAPVAIAAFLCCFAIATILGWGYYGVRCAQYLFGESSAVWKRFAVLQAAVAVLGTMLGTGVVWQMAEIVNGLMAIPNLIALFLLRKRVVMLISDSKNPA